MENKKLSKSDIAASDAMYGVFSVIGAIAILAMLIVTIFIFVSIFTGTYNAFTQNVSASTSDIILFAFVVLASCAIFVYGEVILVKSIIKGIKKYLKVRKESLSNQDPINE